MSFKGGELVLHRIGIRAKTVNVAGVNEDKAGGIDKVFWLSSKYMESDQETPRWPLFL